MATKLKQVLDKIIEKLNTASQKATTASSDVASAKSSVDALSSGGYITWKLVKSGARLGAGSFVGAWTTDVQNDYIHTLTIESKTTYQDGINYFLVPSASNTPLALSEISKCLLHVYAETDTGFEIGAITQPTQDLYFDVYTDK